MKLLFIPAFCLLVTLVSCTSKTAFEYSEAIVRMENELSADIAKADLKVAEYLDAEKRDSAILMSQQMELLVESKLKEVQLLEAPRVKEGNNFKKAAVRYFTYIKRIYSSFKNFTMAPTEEQKEIERQRLARIIKDKKEATEAMQEAQKKFAMANGFKIEQSEKEKKSAAQN